jgi:hypothetical protein
VITEIGSDNFSLPLPVVSPSLFYLSFSSLFSFAFLLNVGAGKGCSTTSRQFFFLIF